jgi:hypothetical protein
MVELNDFMTVSSICANGGLNARMRAFLRSHPHPDICGIGAVLDARDDCLDELFQGSVARITHREKNISGSAVRRVHIASVRCCKVKE